MNFLVISSCLSFFHSFFIFSFSFILLFIFSFISFYLSFSFFLKYPFKEKHHFLRTSFHRPSSDFSIPYASYPFHPILISFDFDSSLSFFFVFSFFQFLYWKEMSISSLLFSLSLSLSQKDTYAIFFSALNSIEFEENSSQRREKEKIYSP